MNMKNILFTISFCLITGLSFSQALTCIGSSDEDYQARLQAGLIGIEYMNPVKDYAGIQYFSNWTQGEVFLEDGDVIRNITLRYDQYLDQLLWLRKTDYRTGILSKSAVIGFKLFNPVFGKEVLGSFVKMDIHLPGLDSASAYVQVLSTGNISLYAYRNANIISTHEYVLNDNTRYIIVSGGNQYPLALRRHSLINLPVVEKTAMKTILRSEGITISKNEEGLIKAIKVYNEKKR